MNQKSITLRATEKDIENLNFIMEHLSKEFEFMKVDTAFVLRYALTAVKNDIVARENAKKSLESI